jgi:uncharacterized protein (DUF1778 family)
MARLRRRSSVTINVRASAAEKALIDRAARALGKSRTEFLLDSARAAAEDALLDRKLFLLSDADYREFVRRLDAPPRPTAALKRLMATRVP